MTTDIFFLQGLLGMILILVAFFLSQNHKLSTDSLTYDLLNFTGSVFLVIYGVTGKAWPFVILNTVWGLVSLRDVILDLMPKKPLRLRKA